MKNLTLNYKELISQTDELRLQVDSLMNELDEYSEEDGVSLQDKASYLTQRWLLDEVVTILSNAVDKLNDANTEIGRRLFPKRKK